MVRLILRHGVVVSCRTTYRYRATSLAGGNRVAWYATEPHVSQFAEHVDLLTLCGRRAKTAISACQTYGPSKPTM